MKTKAIMLNNLYRLHRARGYSLVELMIGMSLGLVLTMGITAMYVQSSQNYERLADEVTRVGNSQFIGNQLRREIQGAGYWGDFTSPTPTGVFVDPCDLSIPTMTLGVSQPIFGFDSRPASPLGCLTQNNFMPGTDILILRRASSVELSALNGPTQGDVYIQSNPSGFVLEFGNSGGYVAPTVNADNSLGQVGTSPSGGPTTLLTKLNVDDPASPEFAMRVAAHSRKYRTDIYFVSPCTIGADGSNICTGGSDDGGEPRPSLKKMELRASGGLLTLQTLVLAEGVENMQIQFGIDTTGSASLGSGSPNIYIPNPTIDQFNDVVSLQVALLLRDEIRSDFVNNNVYTLANETVGPFGDSFSRNVMDATYRIANLSMRRAGSN
jgi:type IV pilus assembly protein PilW